MLMIGTQSGKLPTYPSLKSTLTLSSHLGQNVGLGEGKVGSFPETYNNPKMGDLDEMWRAEVVRNKPHKLTGFLFIFSKGAEKSCCPRPSGIWC